MTGIDPAVLTSDEAVEAATRAAYEHGGMPAIAWLDLHESVRAGRMERMRVAIETVAALATQGRPEGRECGATSVAAGGPCRRPAGHRGIHEHTTEHGFSLWPQRAVEGSGGDDTGEVARLREAVARHARELDDRSAGVIDPNRSRDAIDNELYNAVRSTCPEWWDEQVPGLARASTQEGTRA